MWFGERNFIQPVVVVFRLTQLCGKGSCLTSSNSYDVYGTCFRKVHKILASTFDAMSNRVSYHTSSQYRVTRLASDVGVGGNRTEGLAGKLDAYLRLQYRRPVLRSRSISSA